MIHAEREARTFRSLRRSAKPLKRDREIVAIFLASNNSSKIISFYEVKDFLIITILHFWAFYNAL